MRPFIIGLTGGIATGKSQAAKYLKQLGAYLVDADQIARKVVEIPDVRKKLQKFWPQTFNRGIFHRKTLRQIIFSSRADREKLNHLLHPYILRQAFREIKKCPRKICVFIAPLLIETGTHRKVDCVWVIDAPRKIQIQRLMKRDKIPREEAEKIVQSQISSQKKSAYADFAIRNDGSLAKTKEQIRKGWQRLQTTKKIPSVWQREPLEGE